MLDSYCPVCGNTRRPPAVKLPFAQLVRSDCHPITAHKQVSHCPDCDLIEAFSPQMNASIYENYDRKNFEEPTIMTSLGNRTRSELLSQFLQTRLPQSGRLLDIGCNHGHFAHRFQQEQSQWQVMGYEPTWRPSAIRNQLLPAKSFITGSLDTITDKFDCITLVHVLEHIPKIHELLEQIKSILKPEGRILVQVPAYQRNSFDLCILDHVYHFSARALRTLFESHGYHILHLSHDIQYKEWTLMASLDSRYKSDSVETLESEDQLSFQTAYAFLQNFSQRIKQLDLQTSPIGVLGTAINGILAQANLRGDFWIDENPKLSGQKLLRKMIYLPQEAPIGSRCLLPFNPTTAAHIQLRLQAEFPQVDWLLPESD